MVSAKQDIKDDADKIINGAQGLETEITNSGVVNVPALTVAQGRLVKLAESAKQTKQQADDVKTIAAAEKLHDEVEEQTGIFKTLRTEIKGILEEQKKETVESVSEETTAVASSDNEEWPFIITMLDDDSSISIKINALGTFYYDCGDERGEQELVVSDFKNGGTIDCEIVAAETEIKLGGRAEKYNNDTAIAFYDFGDEWTISGSLGTIFPTLDGGSQPVFMSTFEDCSWLTGGIPADLFKGISGPPAEGMFYSTFEGCSRLTGPIPPGLFAGIQGQPAEEMFDSTFRDCSGLTGTIPADLFAGIEGPPAWSMFYDTFEDCSGLTGPIPEKLFAGIKGKRADEMFKRTFKGCSKLSGEVGSAFFGNITPTINKSYVDSEDIFEGTGVDFKE